MYAEYTAMQYQRLMCMPKPIITGATPNAIKSESESIRSPNMASCFVRFLRVFATAPSKPSKKPDNSRHNTPISGMECLLPPMEKQIPATPEITDR